MTIEEFFFPSKSKIIIFAILLIAGMGLQIYNSASENNWNELIFETNEVVLTEHGKSVIKSQSAITPALLFRLSANEVPAFYSWVINLIYWYLFACVIIWFFSKFRKKAPMN